MTKYKNVLLILLALILFAYAGFITIFPSTYTKSFNKEDFQQKALAATGLKITFNSIDVKIKPNFKTIITLKDVLATYPDDQPLFKTTTAEIITTPSILLSNNIDLKQIVLKYVTYDDQVLVDGQNKLAFFPKAFTPAFLGKKDLTVKPCSVYIKNLTVNYTVSEPYSYETVEKREAVYAETDVENFLKSLNFTNVKIK